MSEETLLEFPCQFPIKAMGIHSDTFESEIVMIVRRFVPQLGEAAVRSKPSKTGKYLSVTITFTAQSKAQVDEIYRAVHAHPEVRMML